MKKKHKGGGGDKILYHFCAGFCLRGILREGLTLGKTPILDENLNLLMVVDNTQWLTSERDKNLQSWATRNILPYSRTDYRLTIRIPASRRKKLFLAEGFMRQYPNGSERLVTAWPGSEKWYIYNGAIPPEWIVAVKKLV